MVKLLDLHDQWSEAELVNTVSERQRVSDMLRDNPRWLRENPYLTDMLGLS